MSRLLDRILSLPNFEQDAGGAAAASATTSERQQAGGKLARRLPPQRMAKASNRDKLPEKVRLLRRARLLVETRARAATKRQRRKASQISACRPK